MRTREIGWFRDPLFDDCVFLITLSWRMSSATRASKNKLLITPHKSKGDVTPLTAGSVLKTAQWKRLERI